MDCPPPPAQATIIFLSHAGIVADGHTNCAPALQMLFDRARDGQPLEIVNDLKGVLVTSGNDLWPNTTVRTLNGATWQLWPGSTRGILRNKHPLASWPAGALRQNGTICNAPTDPDDAHDPTDQAHGDFNISIIGGTFDGDRRSGGWPNDGRTANKDHPQLGYDNLMVSTLQFYGVKKLLLNGVKVWDSPSLAIHLGNVIDVTANDCEIGCPAVIYNSNTDGFHVNGPARNLSISNLHCFQTGDDALPLNADDAMESSTQGNQAAYFGMYSGWGPISHVRIRGLYLERCSSGVRILSASQRIDDVIISEVQGSCFWAPLLIDKYLFNHDAGNIGSLTFSDIHVDTLGLHYDGEAGGQKAPAPTSPGEVMLCNTAIDDLVIRDLAYFPTNASPCLHFLAGTVSMLFINGFICHDVNGGDGMSLIRIDNGATVTSAGICAVNWSSSHRQSGSVIANQGAIGQLARADLALPVEATLLKGLPSGR